MVINIWQANDMGRWHAAAKASACLDVIKASSAPTPALSAGLSLSARKFGSDQAPRTSDGFSWRLSFRKISAGGKGLK
jgi:hypothetical protein